MPIRSLVNVPVHEGQLEPSDKHLLDRAKTQWQFGDWTSLAALGLDLLARHPQRSQLALLAAAGQAQCGAIEDAKASVQQASEWGASRQQVARVLVSGVYNALGKAAAVAGQSERALPLFRSALAVAGPAHEVRLLTGVRTRQQLGQLGFVNAEVMTEWPQEACLPSLRSSPSSNQEILRSKIKKVEELRAENDFETAEELLQEILNEEPQNIAALRELGQLKNLQQHWQQAGDVYDQLLQTQEVVLKTILARARARHNADQLDQEIAELEGAKSLGFDQPELNHQLSVAYRDNQQFAKAEQLIRRILGRFPDYARGLKFATFAADILRKREHVGDAFALLQSAVEVATRHHQEIPFNTNAMLLELRQAATATTSKTEVSKSFYDSVYAHSKEYENDPEHSVYLPTWERVLHKLKAERARRVLDIGCGPGQFAQYLLERIPGLAYYGADYSHTAILQAQRRCPSARFSEADVMQEGALDSFEADVYVILEVLEHIEQDCELLARIPSGKQVIFSVPNFDSFGHVRFFKNEDEVLVRYGELFCTLEVESVPLKGRSKIFLATGVRQHSA